MQVAKDVDRKGILRQEQRKVGKGTNEVRAFLIGVLQRCSPKVFISLSALAASKTCLHGLPMSYDNE